ncbi:GumC family protein [Tunturiibacter gelidoferens]|uniref:non-specific protein-tyrosine kinase n=3 Tax=Tunturiibacter TaxID=3154218 RepID=A0A7Y9T5K4_9BACT|nr:polysaccharide biosynthesis tyrosine autokinase [Edaphobacter lichenicola]MBB5338344.1 capsular exopolysaccharide synthesis family protein [Edaphobacter lichenicola]NYF52409.1 capsular exopolysaccharide synthesis family protein [Edaphobacter lichenicola]
MGSKNTQPPHVSVPETNQAGFSTTVTDTTLSEALIVLRKRKLVLIIAVLLGLAYGIFKAESQPKLYESYGRIQVRSGSSNEYRVSTVQEYSGDSSSKLLSEIEIIKSDSLMLTVCREMDLANNADFLEQKTRPEPRASLEDGETRQDTVHRIQSNLHVTVVPKTDIIRISYSSFSAKLSADIVNKVISDYVQRSYQTRYESSQRASVWLSGTLEGLKQEVEASQEQMMDMQRRLGILGFDPTHNQISTSLDDLARAAGTAKLARIIAEARYRVVSGMDPNTLEGTIELTPGTAPAELNLLRGQLAGAKANYATMESSLGPNHPQSKALKAQIDEYVKEIDEEQNRLIVQAKQNYVVAKANEDQTTAALEAQKTDAYKLRDQLVEYTLRQREYEANRTLYDSLQQRLRTASVQSGLESLEVDVVDQALPPAEPVLRPQSTVIITALVFAMLAGIVVAFLMESLDTGLRSIAEIESITELPSLAIIPRARRSSVDQAATLSTAQRNVGILTQPKSQFAEAFRSLRTSLLLSSTGHPPKYIVLTSATPSEGKTTAASNLAAILAQRDTRVLLIDGDLRRPNVHHRFGLNGKIGLTTVLTGATKLEETVQRVPEIPNLDILPSGPVPPFPTEMLSSAAMETILKRCGELYDYIVIDSPPILSVTDGVILARQADAVVLVVRHGKSSKHVVRRARDLLLRSGATITGIVLNAVDMNSPEYYGYYGYSGYSYSSVDSDSWESQTASTRDHTNAGETKR